MKEKLLKYENMKLKNQYIFTLPATKEVCSMVCKGCYAAKAQVRFPKALEYRERMLERSKSKEFTDNIVDELNKSKKDFKAVRIHESGEFYSQEYLNKWVEIAKRLPSIRFYAFTKRKKDFDFTEAEAQDNLIIIDSLKFGGLNYGTLDEMNKLVDKYNTRICPATFKGASKDTCGVTCSYCWTKTAQHKGVVFVKH